MMLRVAGPTVQLTALVRRFEAERLALYDFGARK